MRTIFIILTLFLFSGPSFSQNGWVQVYDNPGIRLSKNFFINNSTGWILADSNKILKTTNGGFGWTLLSITNPHPIRDIYFINENTGWAAGGRFETWGSPGNKMVVLKTSNGGLNWIQQLEDSDLYNVLNIIYFSDANNGIAFGSGGTGSGGTGVIRRTTNGGLNWTSQSNGDITTLLLKKDVSGNLLRVAHYGDDIGRDTTYFYSSTNQGTSWNLKSRFSKIFNITDLDILSDNSILITGRADSILFRRVLLKSTDQGVNWSMTVLDSVFSPSQFTYVNSNTGWAVSPWFTYKTTNAGFNWSVNFSSPLNLYMFDSLKGLGTASGGKIYLTGTGGVMGTGQMSSNIPDKFSLSQNYPNPFNPTTKINYELPITNSVSIKVYDALGNEIETLVNEKQNAGSYSVDFNAALLPSGVYFYKLVTEKFSKTKKIVLVK